VHEISLASEGFHTPNTVQACVELCGKPQDKITFAIINEAYAVEPGDKRWVLDNINSVTKNFPARLDMVNLLALSIDQVEARIAPLDAIFVVGGYTDYLMHVFNKTGFSKLLPKLLRNQSVYRQQCRIDGRPVSASAPRLQRIYGERDDYGITDYLGFVDLAIKPHLDSPEFPNNLPEVLEEVASGADFPVYGLRDDAAIVVRWLRAAVYRQSTYKVKS